MKKRQIIIILILTFLLGFSTALAHQLYLDLKISNQKIESKSSTKIKTLKRLKREKLFTVIATAYSLEESQCNRDLKNTAIMVDPKPGWHIAVSTDLIWLLGEKVYIEKVGVRKVVDLMNKRYENRIDIMMPSKEKAIEFGKKELKMVVIGN